MLDWAPLDNFHFLRPWWLLGMVPLAVGLAMQWHRRRTQSRWEGIIAPDLLKHLLVSGSESRTFSPQHLAMLLGLLAVVAAAGPSWRQASDALFKDEAALVIALDVSATMETTDVQPSRLERAKQKISDLLAVRGVAPTSLIAFAGSAHTVIPLTADPSIIDNLLAAITPRIMPVRGQQPATVLPIAGALLDPLPAPGTVLLITDNATDADVAAFRTFFENRSDQLLVWGIGTAEGGAPFGESTLRALAAAGGGSYQSLSLDDADARRVARLTQSHLVATANEFSPWVDDGYFLVIPMAALIAFWFRRGWSISWD